MPTGDKISLIAAAELIHRLKSGRHISDEHLKAVLSSRRWLTLQANINARRAAVHAKKSVPNHIRAAMTSYNELLASADKLDRTAECTKPSSIPTAVNKRQIIMRGMLWASGKSSREIYRLRAESAYEKAIEKLHEVIDEFPEVLTYLDRYPVFDGDGFNITPDAAGVPRLVTSISRYNMTPTSRVSSISSLKINALEMCISELTNSSQ